MLLLVFIRVAEGPPVWERAVHLVYCACFSRCLSNFVCVLLSLLVLRVGCGMCLYLFLIIAFLFTFHI